MKPQPSRAQPRRPMTSDELTMAFAVSPMKVRYVPWSGDKAFAWTMLDQAEHGTPPSLTERQAQYLITLVLRMRRQVAADVLAIAERLASRNPHLPPRRPLPAAVALALLTIAYAAGCSNCWAVPGCRTPAPAPAPKDTVRR